MYIDVKYGKEKKSTENTDYRSQPEPWNSNINYHVKLGKDCLACHIWHGTKVSY